MADTDRPTRPLPQGGGNKKLMNDVIHHQQKVFGIIGLQQRNLNTLNKNFTVLMEKLVTAEDLAGINSAMESSGGSISPEDAASLLLANQELLKNNVEIKQEVIAMSANLTEMVELTKPISAHFREAAEGQKGPTTGGGGGIVGGGGGSAGAEGKAALDEVGEGADNAKGGFAGLLGVLGGGAAGGAAGGTVAGALTAVGIGLGAVGVGLGLITGALYLGAAAVDKFGKGMESVADGMEELQNVDVEVEQFNKLGAALGALIKDIGIRGGMGLLLLAKSDFEGLADGITRLDQVEFDPSNLEEAGRGIGLFLAGFEGKFMEGFTAQMVDDNLIPLAKGLESLSESSKTLDEGFVGRMTLGGLGIGQFLKGFEGKFGASITASMIDDNLIPLADGLASLSESAQRIDNSFVSKMRIGGMGVSELLDGVGGEGFGEILGNFFGGFNVQMVDDNLIPLADGIAALSKLEDVDKFAENMKHVGPGFQALMDGTDDVFGAMGLQGIDDNLIPLAAGIRELTTLEETDKFEQKMIDVGKGFQALLDGTDDLFGATGIQMIDDNLIPLREGMDAIAGVDAELFNAKAKLIRTGFEDLFDTFREGAGTDFNMEHFTKNMKDAIPNLEKAIAGDDGGWFGTEIKGLASPEIDYETAIERINMIREAFTGMQSEVGSMEISGVAGGNAQRLDQETATNMNMNVTNNNNSQMNTIQNNTPVNRVNLTQAGFAPVPTARRVTI